MHPNTGVIKLWEKDPESVEKLFNETLFGYKDHLPSEVQNRMDTFIEEYNALRVKYFPTNWSYQQDRHSVSVYLAMNDPDYNYVYKSSEALTMSKYVDFGFSIGTGKNFSLENYYHLCDEIVLALKEHQGLLDKHFSRLTDGHYIDKSLHLLAFDLMYCCSTYGYYKGLTVPVSGKTMKKSAEPLTPAELAQEQQNKAEKIAALEQKIIDLENSCKDCKSISLIGTQVSFKNGLGTVVAQTINKITVQFKHNVISFVIDKKYKNRPKFENDEEIVELFSNYGQAQEQIKSLQKEIALLQK